MLHSAAILTFGVRNNHFMMTETPKKIQLKGMTLEKISDYLTEIGEPAYRAKQVFDWMYNRNAASYADMLNLPKALRDTLAEQTILTTLNLITVQES
ncbi:partial putative dual-specificity RNA methyltransferase RlmN, partial [Candidatus Brocadiaceae bacterium]